MSKKSNPTIIGAFVVGAVILLATGIAFFGGAEMLSKRETYVAYFVEDTRGLRVGSNVMLNGVRVGQVSGMALIIDEESFESKTEVTMDIMPETFVVTRGGVVLGKDVRPDVPMEQVVEQGGLRALLQVESFVTGQLLVELDFRPDTGAIMRGGDYAPYTEIPTIPSNIQELLAKVQNWIGEMGEHFDAQAIGVRLQSVLKGLDELANSPDLRQTLAGVNTVINREDTQELPATLEAMLNQFNTAAGDASRLMNNADGKLDALESSLKPVIEELASVLQEAKATLAEAKSQLQGDSIESYQLNNTLKEVENAARSLREFLDYLDRNPEAVLRGKKQ
jgi:paraquat-inducible protein B